MVNVITHHRINRIGTVDHKVIPKMAPIKVELRRGTLLEGCSRPLLTVRLDAEDVANGRQLRSALNIQISTTLYACRVDEDGAEVWDLIHDNSEVPKVGGMVRLLAAPAPQSLGAAARHIAVNEVPEQGESLVERAFYGPYVGDRLPLNVFLMQLDENFRLWDPSIYHSPYTCLVQSSGWGKSKAIYQLGADMQIFVVYCSFLPAKSRGFPKRTPHVVASIFQEGFTRVKGVAYLIAAANAVASSGLNPAAWMTTQMKQADEVGKLIFQEYLEVSKLLVGRERDESFLSAQLETALGKVPAYRSGNSLQLLYAFDEAKLMPDWPDNFLELRRSLRLIPGNVRAFALFCGTSSKVVNYSPASRKDRSTKVAKEGLKLFPPLRLVSCPDTFLGKRKRGSESPLMFLFGRPMWGAFVDQGMSTEDLVRLAVTKMLGGREIGADDENVTPGLAAALFGVSAGSTVVCSGGIVEDMVSSHMSTLVWISEDRELLRLCHTSEPVLGEAVARLFWKYDYFGPCLKRLAQLCDDGLVLEGVRGELVARIILLLAMHKAAKGMGTAFYTTPVSVVDFFEALLGTEAAAMLKPLGSKEGPASRTFKHGKICFNQFLPMTCINHGTHRGPAPSTINTYMPQDKLQLFYQRAAAFMFAEGEWAAEFGLPISVQSHPSAHSFCDVQVKNLKDALSPKAMGHVGSKLAAHAGTDAIKLVMCFSPKPSIHVDGSEVVVVGGPEQYPCVAGYEDLLQQILKSRLNVDLEKVLTGNELAVAKKYVPWLYTTEVFD